MEANEVDILSKNHWGYVRELSQVELLHLRFKQISINLNDVELNYLIDELENDKHHEWFNTYLGQRVFIHAVALNLDFVFSKLEKDGLLKLLREAYLVHETRRIIKYKAANK